MKWWRIAICFTHECRTVPRKRAIHPLLSSWIVVAWVWGNPRSLSSTQSHMASFVALDAAMYLGLRTVTVCDGCTAVIVRVPISYHWSQNICVIRPSQYGLPVIFSRTMTGANGHWQCIRFVFNARTMFESHSLWLLTSMWPYRQSSNEHGVCPPAQVPLLHHLLSLLLKYLEPHDSFTSFILISFDQIAWSLPVPALSHELTTKTFRISWRLCLIALIIIWQACSGIWEGLVTNPGHLGP
jgi:hypothetical protein